MIATLRQHIVRMSERRDQREFLAAALEIIETPPSPVARAGILTIALAAAAALAWAVIGHTDVVAIAHGKLQPVGRTKVIQPLEPGKVREVRVANGDRVAAGDVVMILDQDEARADVVALTTGLAAARAEAIRRGAALAAIRGGALRAPALSWPDEIPLEIREREEAVIATDLGQFAGQVAANRAQRGQKDAEILRLQNTAEAQKALIDVLRERVDTRDGLSRSGSGTRSSLIDAQETLAYHATTLATQLGQIEEGRQALLALDAEVTRLTGQVLADQADKRLQAQRQADDLAQKLAKAETRLERLTLRSPVAGIVQSLAVTTVGQVVPAGVELMRIVPRDERLEVELYLPNRDAGFVSEGQAVSVKLDAFPFTRFGTLQGHVARIGRDAIPEPDAMAVEGDSTKAPDGRAPAGAQRISRLVFPVTVVLDTQTIEVDGRAQSLSPGLSATGEIKVRQRRIIDFLLAPLRETTSQALREM